MSHTPPGHGARPGIQTTIQDWCFLIMLITCLALSAGILTGHQTRVGITSIHLFTADYYHLVGLIIFSASLIRGWFYITRLINGKVSSLIVGVTLFFAAWRLLSPATFKPVLGFLSELLAIVLDLLNWIIELLGGFF